MSIYFQREYVKCGKQCKSCPHGPYWYGYWRVGKQVRKRYYGKADPRPHTGQGGAGQGVAGEREEAPAVDAREAIFNARTATLSLACSILAITSETSKAGALKRYKELIKLHHPDRGGDPKETQFIVAAWTWLKAFKDW